MNDARLAAGAALFDCPLPLAAASSFVAAAVAAAAPDAALGVTTAAATLDLRPHADDEADEGAKAAAERRDGNSSALDLPSPSFLPASEPPLSEGAGAAAGGPVAVDRPLPHDDVVGREVDGGAGSSLTAAAAAAGGRSPLAPAPEEPTPIRGKSGSLLAAAAGLAPPDAVVGFDHGFDIFAVGRPLPPSSLFVIAVGFDAAPDEGTAGAADAAADGEAAPRSEGSGPPHAPLPAGLSAPEPELDESGLLARPLPSALPAASPRAVELAAPPPAF